MAAPDGVITSDYRKLNVMRLPEPLKSNLLCDLEMSNDSGCIVNPEYHPDLAEWLRANGEDPTECFIAWASW